MPKLAKALLIQRLLSSGLLDQLRSDARVLFRKRLWFESEQALMPLGSVHTRISVGAITLGFIGFTASENDAKNKAYLRWLSMAARCFADELTAPDSQAIDAIPAKIMHAARIIRGKHTEPLSLGDVASQVALSRERLSRLFHASLGVSFSEYLNLNRLNTARRLLEEGGFSITRIAHESGYQSLSQFNRRFREAERMSPSNYRKRFAPQTD